MRFRVVIMSLLFACLNCSCQNKLNDIKGNKEILVNDYGDGSYLVSKDSIDLLKMNLWDNDSYKIGMMYIPVSPSAGIKLGFSFSGQLINKSEVKNSNGKLIENGKSYRFNDKGVLVQVYTYKEGILEGEYISYFENGICEVKGNYKKGEFFGEWFYYNESGKVVRKKDYPAAQRVP